MKKFKEAEFSLHDLETTGVSTEDRAIESALAHVKGDELIEFIEELNYPGDEVKIKPGAAMTHGYRNSDVKGKPLFKETKSFTKLENFSKKENLYYVAHNAPFDLGMLEKEGITFDKSRVIDTLKVARHTLGRDLSDTELAKHLWCDEAKEPEMFKLQYFRYFFDPYFEKEEPKYMKKFGIDFIQPHTALSDILVLWIFMDLIAKTFKLTPEDMVEMTQKPALESKISFGKVFERGTPYEEVIESTYVQYNKEKKGYDYLIWAIEKMESLPLDREYSLRYHVARGILNKKIPLHDKTRKYLIWGLIFIFNKEEIKNAAAMLGCETTYTQFTTGYENGTKKTIESLKNSIDPEDVDEAVVADLNKKIYMKEFYDAHRKKLFV